MEYFAQTIGYAVMAFLGLFGVLSLGLLVFSLIKSLYFFVASRKNLRILNKLHARCVSDSACKAVDILHGFGIKDTHTLGEVRVLLEQYQNRYRIK